MGEEKSALAGVGPTNQDAYDAIMLSIERRWRPAITNGFLGDHDCSLCEFQEAVSRWHTPRSVLPDRGCQGCPLWEWSLATNQPWRGCGARSPYSEYSSNADEDDLMGMRASAKRMVKVLEEVREYFFWDWPRKDTM